MTKPATETRAPNRSDESVAPVRTTKTLHVLPKLMVTDAHLRSMNCGTVSLRITSRRLRLDVSTGDDLVIRQPVPNRRYFVAGTATARWGFEIPVPAGIDKVDLLLEWGTTNTVDNTVVVKHALFVDLLPGQATAYTMDATEWPRLARSAAKAPLYLQPSTLLEGASSYLADHREIKFRTTEYEVPGSDLVAHLFIAERVKLEPIDPDRIPRGRHANQQLHELDHATAFSMFTQAHHSAGCVALHPAVLFAAISAARSQPFDAHSEFGPRAAGGLGRGCESHPALIILSDWWNGHAPDAATRRAAMAAIFVRVRDRDEYWSADLDVPCTRITAAVSCAAASATVGPFFHVEFLQGRSSFTFNPSVTSYLVTGDSYETVGVRKADLDSGEYDHAWFYLQALANIPTNYPRAWAWLKNETTSHHEPPAD